MHRHTDAKIIMDGQHKCPSPMVFFRPVLHIVKNVKAPEGIFNQEKAIVGFSVIVKSTRRFVASSTNDTAAQFSTDQTFITLASGQAAVTAVTMDTSSSAWSMTCKLYKLKVFLKDSYKPKKT